MMLLSAIAAGTAGSGDAAIAGFLSAILRDFTAAQTLDAAAAVGARYVGATDT